MRAHAVEVRRVARNIAQEVRKPKAPATLHTGVIDQQILSPAEIARLVNAVPADHRTTVNFLFRTGVRFGELLGAMWSDVDWASSRVLIRRQRSGMTGELTAPKTQAGTRWIDLDAQLIKELKALRLRTPGDFVFPLAERNWRSRVWHPSLRRAGLRSVRIHDARHRHASLLIAAGADVVAVSRRLGHANPSITLTVYSHVFARRDAAPLGEKLAAFMLAESGGCD
ncbi:MAG: site-specific integrase [Steroidobacteraceae bacterium]